MKDKLSDMDIASASVGLVPVGATTGSYIAIEMTRPKKQLFSVKIKFSTAQCEPSGDSGRSEAGRLTPYR